MLVLVRLGRRQLQELHVAILAREDDLLSREPRLRRLRHRRRHRHRHAV
jgi:hypothetical protein